MILQWVMVPSRPNGLDFGTLFSNRPCGWRLNGVGFQSLLELHHPEILLSFTANVRFEIMINIFVFSAPSRFGLKLSSVLISCWPHHFLRRTNHLNVHTEFGIRKELYLNNRMSNIGKLIFTGEVLFRTTSWLSGNGFGHLPAGIDTLHIQM